MTQRVAPSNVLLQLLDDSFRDEYTDWKRRNLRFSDAGAAAPAGAKCEREIVYDLMDTDRSDKGEPELKTHLTSGSLAFFSAGRIHEQEIRRRLRLVLRSPEKEVAMFVSNGAAEPTILAKGKIDNTIFLNTIRKLLPEELQTIEDDPGLEIKSVNQFSFDVCARTGQLQQEHYDQVQLYLGSTKKPFWIVLLENRNSFGPEKGALPFLEFLVLPDLERQRELEKGLELTRQAYHESKTTGRNIVPRPFERTSSKCSYCRFKRDCWGDEPAAIEIKPDSTVKAPSQELVESAARTALTVEGELKTLEAQQHEAKQVLETYFKATGAKELIVGEIKVVAIRSSKTFLDDQTLRAKLSRDKYLSVSRPVKAEIQKAIENREVDASVLDEATKAIYSQDISIRLYPVKPATERKATDGKEILSQTPTTDFKKTPRNVSRRGKKKNTAPSEEISKTPSRRNLSKASSVLSKKRVSDTA